MKDHKIKSGIPLINARNSQESLRKNTEVEKSSKLSEKIKNSFRGFFLKLIFRTIQKIR